MPIIVVLEGAADDRCVVRLSPIAELSAALHALNEIEHHPRSRQWAASVAAAVDRDVLERAADWAPLWGSLRARFLLPLDERPERTLDKELADVEALGVPHFVAMCAEAIVDRDRTIRYDRLSRDETVVRQFLERASHLSPERLALAKRLVDDPASLRRDLVAFLRAFAASGFEREWRSLESTLRQDARRRCHDLERRGLGVIADLTTTAHEHPRPRRVVFDKLYDGTAKVADQVCLLVPSVHVRPHVTIKHNAGLPIVIQYAVGGTDDISYEVVRRRMLTLSDPIRVRMCRWILREPHTTSDLARRMGMSEPQVSRHLRRLREAGLVRTRREGRLVFYTLDAESLRRLGGDLLDALRR